MFYPGVCGSSAAQVSQSRGEFHASLDLSGFRNLALRFFSEWPGSCRVSVEWVLTLPFAKPVISTLQHRNAQSSDFPRAQLAERAA